MFAKLGALAVLLPFVSALTITCPTQVTIGATVDVTVETLPTDPSVAAFLIVGDGVDVELNANVALDATVTLDIPADLPVGFGYVIVAVDVDNVNEPLAQTAPFNCVDSDN